MNQFSTALRQAFRYRLALAGVLVSSLAVAVFWGANLGSVYPIVEVVLKGKSLPEWVDESIARSTESIAEHREASAELREQLSEDVGNGDAENGDVGNAIAGNGRARRELDREIYQHDSRVEAEVRALKLATTLRPAIDRYMPRTPFATLGVVVIALLAGSVLKSIFLIFNVVLVERLAHLITFDLRKRFYRNTLAMSLADFSRQPSSELMSRMTHDMNALNLGLVVVFGRAIREPLKMAACLIGAGLVCWRLLLLSLVVTPLAMYLINRLAKSVRRANRRAMEEMSQLYGRLDESFSGIQAVKAFTMERYERRRFHQLAKVYFHKAMKIVTYDSFTKPSTEIMSIAVVSLALLTGGYLVLNQETHLLGLKMCERPLTFGALMAFFALLAGVSDPSRKLAEVFHDVQRAAAAAERVYSMMDRQPSIVDPPRPKPLPAPLDELSFRNVSFHYQPDCPVLCDVSLRIPAGKSVAIVGPNGCGKTTLMNLIPRFYDPQQGAVLWNDVDLRKLRMRDFRQRIGMVTQHTQLFDDTVMNNIRYGSLGATDQQVIDAARRANADRFICEKLPHGYQTVIGQAGKLLSGGQRQRIALARAILRDPEILILDEATSQIDLESERLIHRALASFVVGRTALMITHRLATLELADLIIVMDGGQVLDVGTHDQLLQRCEFYQRLQQHKAA
ncbi:MAG: ABC transporter ATP-binding protein [Pirellulaceae bacterium]|nr:ABC transporter ATP-binding protein [Planctomycetales bacterium]